MNQILNSIYGYYKVGDQYYLNKTEASYNASLRKQPLEWNFHNELFSSIDWTQRPSGTLADMYRERAQQIRDKYDYVMVSFSGGMDSWNVLHSFLSNGIHIDEVVTRWQRAERKYTKLSNSTEQANVGSEYEFAVLPVLKHIQKTYPNVKVTLDDFSNTIEGEEFTEEIFNRCYNYQNVASFSKYTNRTEGEIAAMNQNKRIAFVTGAEKTHVANKDGNFYAFFTDQSNGGENDHREVEFFYWSPDYPMMPVMQAHMLLDYIKQGVAAGTVNNLAETNFKYTYAKVCYPEFNIDTFQVSKKFGTLLWDSDKWIAEYNPKYYDSWKWATDQYFQKIDNQYLKTHKDNTPIGLKLLDSPYYLIESNTNLPEFKK